MFKDFESFGINVKNSEGNVDTKFMEMFIKEMVSQANTDVITDDKIFFKYEFKNSPARVGIMLSKESEMLQYEDCTTYLETLKPIKVKILEKISDEKILVQIDKLKIEIYMNIKDRKIDEEVNIALSVFPVKLEIFNDENDYLENGKIENKEGKTNLFNLNVGTILPIMKLLRGDFNKYSNYVEEESFDVYDDSFSVVTGKITYAQKVNNIMEVNNKDVQISQFDYYSINTQYGEIATAVPRELYQDIIDKKDVELTEKSVFKIYGYLVGNIIEEIM